MFGALAEGSQWTDGVLILSVPSLPPILHPSTYHSVVASTCNVSFLFPQETNVSFCMPPLLAQQSCMQWLQEIDDAVSCHPCLCTHRRLWGRVCLYHCCAKTYKHQWLDITESPFDLREHRAFDLVSDKAVCFYPQRPAPSDPHFD